MTDQNTPNGTDTREIVKALARRIEEVIELLRAQQQILQKRGMNLPMGSVDQLRTLKTRMDGLAKMLGSSGVELRTLRALAETTALINSSLEPSEVLNRVIDTVIQLTGAERGYIVLKNRETGELEFAVARGMEREILVATPPAEPQENSIPGASKSSDYIISKSVVNAVMATGQPEITSNAIEDERWQQKQSIVGYALRSIMAVPLKVRDEVIGAVYCDNRIMAGLFQQHELALLTAFTNQAAVAIDNARLFEEARMQLAQVTAMRDLMDNVFSSISSGVVTIDGERHITLMNTAAMSILGVDISAYGRLLLEVLPPMDEKFLMALDIVQQTGKGVLVESQPVLSGLGERFWNVTVTVLRGAGYGQGLALVIDDLTEQKQREAQLAEVKRYLPVALVNNIRSVDEVDTRGQEREITALFADVRGFTSFSERLQPEELMRIINRYLSVASDAINLYGGIVDKYMGDAVTGLFNTQLNPQENHALRAVQAAFSIIYDLYALHEVLPEDQRLFYGIGVHTGVAVLGNVGSEDRKEFAVLGEASDISKVLQENAKRGEIIVSPQTYAYIENDFECEEIPLEKTKGRKDLTVGYKILRRKKGSRTSSILLDSEFADLLKD